MHVPWQREFFFGGGSGREPERKFLTVHPRNQENQGDLAQEDMLDVNMSFN